MSPDSPDPRQISRIVLVGFMGAGKSTTGPILATRLGWRFIDSDRHIEAKSGSTIAEIFARWGEPEFRRLEAEVVDQLHREPEIVLALGGGAIESELTRKLLAGSTNTCVVFLKAPLEVLLNRCEQQPGAANRPLLREREALAERFRSRQRHYETAHVVVETQGLPPLKVADLILDALHERPFSMPSPITEAERI